MTMRRHKVTFLAAVCRCPLAVCQIILFGDECSAHVCEQRAGSHYVCSAAAVQSNQGRGQTRDVLAAVASPAFDTRWGTNRGAERCIPVPPLPTRGQG